MGPHRMSGPSRTSAIRFSKLEAKAGCPILTSFIARAGCKPSLSNEAYSATKPLPLLLSSPKGICCCFYRCFYSPHLPQQHVISTEAAHSPIVRSEVEKSASLPSAPLPATTPLLLLAVAVAVALAFVLALVLALA
jgi:hypothetical protein